MEGATRGKAGGTPSEASMYTEHHEEVEESSPLPGESMQKPWRVRLKAELSRFMFHMPPSWFILNMGTGITAILLHEMPYPAHWLRILSYIVFLFDVILFVLIIMATVIRYTRWPILIRLLLRHPVQSMFLGTFSIGLSNIVNLCVLVLAPLTRHGFTVFTWVLWWINVAVALSLIIGMPVLQFTRQEQSLVDVSGALIIPVISCVVVAGAGANLAAILHTEHAKLTVIVCYILWGGGFMMSFICTVLLYARLSFYKVPDRSLLITIFMPLGLCGMGSYTLLRLSSVIYNLSHSTGQALVAVSEMSGENARLMALIVYSGTIPVALCIWGLGLVWLCISLSLLIDVWIVSRIPFSLGWWGLTFPLGTFSAAAGLFAKEFNSEAFRVVGTALAVIEILIWVLLVSLTAYRVVMGRIVVAPSLTECTGPLPVNVPVPRQYEFEPRNPILPQSEPAPR